MGTSKSFGGPKGPQPLLPPWFDDGGVDGDDNSEIEPTPAIGKQPRIFNPEIAGATWSQARSSLTRYVSSPTRSNLRRAARAYSRAVGGSKGAARSAVSFKRTGARFLKFISGVSSKGLAATLELFGLAEIIGRSSDYAIAKIADKLAPQGDTLEDVDARKAFVDTMAELYTQYLSKSTDLKALESLKVEDIQLVFLSYVANYIFQRWLHALGISLEKKNVSPAKAIKLEKEIRAYVRAQVKYDFQSIDLLSMDESNAKAIINDILNTAYGCIQ